MVHIRQEGNCGGRRNVWSGGVATSPSDGLYPGNRLEKYWLRKILADFGGWELASFGWRSEIDGEGGAGAVNWQVTRARGVPVPDQPYPGPIYELLFQTGLI